MRRRRCSSLVVAVALATAGCSGGQDAPRRTTSPATDRPTATASPSPPAATPTGEPTSPPATDDPAEAGLRLEEVARGFELPLHALPAPAGGLLVVEQPGRIQLLRDGEATPYLDIVDRVTSGGERGLLGVAFPPDGQDRVFVHYSGVGGRTTLSAFAVGPDAADPGSEEILLTVDQPAANHNGGQILFGPDGHLYLGLGDGGGADDRFDNGQDPHTLLGSILRLDVTASEGAYDIPADNPFADGRDGAPEVWAYGLRNPYRLDFGDGRLFVADVGQNAVEEINAEPADAAGRNYGWPILEGPDCFAEAGCDGTGTVRPLTSYRHEDTGGCAVIGGEVYEGTAIPALVGWYVYSDLCAGFLRAVRPSDGGVEEVDLTGGTGQLPGVLGFGHDADGELLIALQDGRVLRLVPA